MYTRLCVLVLFIMHGLSYFLKYRKDVHVFVILSESYLSEAILIWLINKLVHSYMHVNEQLW